MIGNPAPIILPQILEASKNEQICGLVRNKGKQVKQRN